MPGPRDFFRRNPQETHSWPYWATDATPMARLLILGLSAWLTALAALLIAAVNPEAPGNWGWNTVERIADPVSLHDYARDGATAMAKSGPWLALATPKAGLVVVSARSRVPLSSGEGGVLDVSEGPWEGSFFSIEASQGVALTTRAAWGWRRTHWLAAPASPSWRGARTFGAGDVIFTELDESGLLLAARDAGLARNLYSRSGGALQRTRGWQVSGLSAFRLDRIASTAKGYWLAGTSGGIRFADRATLEEVPEQRAANAGRVRRLAAAKRGDWAAAVDEKGSAWFFKEGAWSGPWFGSDSGGLKSVGRVAAARLSGGDLWLGAAGGLFRYDTKRHRYEDVVTEGPVEELETIGKGVFAAGPSGLHFAGAGGFSKRVERVDTVPAGGMRVSPSGDTVVYWGIDRGTRTLRAVTGPPFSDRPLVVHVDGWRAVGTPVLRGVIQHAEEDSALFVTDAGCFIYGHGPGGSSYQDCSSAAVHRGAQAEPSTFTVRSFDRVTREDGAVLASAGSRWFMLDRRSWTVLDPGVRFGAAGLERVTAASGKVYGLTGGKKLVSFAGSGAPSEEWGGDGAFVLGAGDGPFRGDLDKDADRWRLSIIRGGRLCEYRSDKAEWSETEPLSEPKQVWYFGDGRVVVTKRGTLEVWRTPGYSFGEGGLPFAPTEATALASGGDGTVLVGGPEGGLARYYPHAGRWEDLTSLPPRTGSVVQLEDTPTGLWARSSSGEVFRLGDRKRWERQPSVRRWTLSPDGAQWIVSSASVTVIRSDKDGGDAVFSRGDGMESFAARARYVWQPDPLRVVLVAPGGVGVFDSRRDRWWTIPALFAEDAGFFPVEKGILIRHRGQDWLLTRKLRIRKLSASEAATLAPTTEAGGGSLAYGGLALDWTLDASGRVKVGWRGRPDIPVWGSTGGRLAVQCVLDVAFDKGGSEVVLATEAGVLRRRSKDYAVFGMEPGRRESLDHLRPAPAAAAGGMEWRLGRGIAVSSGGRALGWTRLGEEWRLDADIVESVRVMDQKSLVIVTRAGAWAWDYERGGRVKPVPAPRPIDKRVSIETPAIKLVQIGQEIRGTSFDGGSAIQSGRFFFDDMADIRGQGGALYSLTAGRAVVRRDGSAPGRLTGAWALPPARPGGGWSLEAGAAGIRLKGPNGAYELDEGGGKDAWKPARPMADRITAGPWVWRRPAPGSPWEVRYEGNGSSWTVSQWWSRGRFAWDDYQAAGPMNGGRVALATPAGVVIRRLGGGLDAVLKSNSFHSSETARRAGRVVGTLFDGGWLLETGPDGRPRLGAAPAGLSRSVSVVFAAAADPGLGRVLGFSEEWRPEPGQASPLVSRVSAVPSQALLHAGRFVFDLPSAAAVVAGTRCFTVTGCGSLAGCLGAAFAERNGALLLTGLFALRANISTLSASSDSVVFGLAEGSRAFQIRADGVSEVSPGRTGDAFNAGHAARLSVPSLKWTATSVKAWDPRPRLTSDTSGYPLLLTSPDGDTAFPFDVLNTLAMDVGRGRLAIGTKGGLFTCPREALDSSVVELARACRFTWRPSGNEGRKPSGEIRRVRPAPPGTRGGPYDGFDVGESVRIRDDAGSRFLSGLGIHFPPGEVQIGDAVFTGSNNAWWLGRRKFRRIVDAAYDERTRVLWVCDEASGLFALRLDKLASRR